ncbi:PAS domain S-box protein [Falsihalocynthiibacter sp. S25ZX9]|uniref:PAS domain S-box protein n=1 Tax=Falsihalocynthiibacter sp. S25ZX9 TaxID=3240870 RepID=UPI00350FDC86
MTIDDHALLLATLDAAVDAIIVSDRKGVILRLNKAAAEMFGWPIDKLIGQNARILVPGGTAARHEDFITTYLQTAKKEITGSGRDVEGLRANGTVFPLHVSIGKADIQGDVAFVAIVHDLTRRKATEEALARSQRMEAIGQMTGGIAHDFNNLLTVVIGNLELLQMKSENEEGLALISDALEAAELGADLTSRLMVVSRKSALTCEVIAMNDVVKHSMAILKRTITARINIQADLAENLWPTVADKTQFQTAILNLALNARDALSEGGRIHIDTRNVTLDDTYLAQEIGVKIGNYIRLSVSDNGEGMSRETQRHAIDPFFTTKPVGKGTGMGLSLVYGFVKQSGGHLTIYSEVKKGTTINLYFPALIGADELKTLTETVDHKFQNIGAGRRVLVVEDDPRVLRLSQTRLLALDFECITATSGDIAWDILQARDDIDLVFTDLVMPGKLSGYDLAKNVTKHRPDVHVMVTSGFSEGVLLGGRVREEFKILRKPYRQAELVEALQAVLDND